MLPDRARNKSPGTSGSRRGDDFTPRPRKTVILQPITRDWAVATHFAATRALRRLKGSDTVSQQNSNGNLAVKLLRTFAAQTEALQRYRAKGQQKVTVEHVHVHTGGQAIVGSVSQSGGGRDNDENRGQPHAPENAGTITFAPGTTLPSANEAREAMPVAKLCRTAGAGCTVGSPLKP